MMFKVMQIMLIIVHYSQYKYLIKYATKLDKI